MVLAGYYLSRCSQEREGFLSSPPKALNVGTWNGAYDFFFDAFGDDRTIQQFRNSLRAVRDVFDTIFDNGRRGWHDKDGNPASRTAPIFHVHEEWRNYSDDVLEKFILSTVKGYELELAEPEHPSIARTEGGRKVYISMRPERDRRLRAEAIRIHGVVCRGCDKSFQDVYGEIGIGFIEIHHVRPIHEKARQTNPKTDLIPVCANCHRMIHYSRDECLTIERLREIIEKQKSKSK